MTGLLSNLRTLGTTSASYLIWYLGYLKLGIKDQTHVHIRNFRDRYNETKQHTEYITLPRWSTSPSISGPSQTSLAESHDRLSAWGVCVDLSSPETMIIVNAFVCFRYCILRTPYESQLAQGANLPDHWGTFMMITSLSLLLYGVLRTP